MGGFVSIARRSKFSNVSVMVAQDPASQPNDVITSTQESIGPVGTDERIIEDTVVNRGLESSITDLIKDISKHNNMHVNQIDDNSGIEINSSVLMNECMNIHEPVQPNLSDDQLQFAEILNSRLEQIAKARETELDDFPETENNNTEVSTVNEALVLPKLHFPSMIIKTTHQLNKKKRIRKKNLDRGKEVHLPRSFYTIPVYAPGSPVRERDPFSPFRQFTAPTIEESREPQDILEQLRIKQSDLEIELDAKAKKIIRYKTIRASITNFHMMRQGELAFALGHHTRASQEINSILGSSVDYSNQIDVTNESMSVLSLDELSTENGTNIWTTKAVSASIDEDVWISESPSEVQAVLKFLETKRELSGDMEKYEAELFNMRRHDRNLLDLSRPITLEIAEFIHTDTMDLANNELGDDMRLARELCSSIRDNKANENDESKIEGDSLSSDVPETYVPILAYSPAYKPFYSPEGYLEFVDGTIDDRLNHEPNVVYVNAFVDGAELKDLIAGLSDNSCPIFTSSPDARTPHRAEVHHRLSPIVKLPTDKIWKTQPYCRNLVLFLEGKTWPYSRGVDLIWDMLECDMILELAEEVLAEEQEEARLAAEAEKNKMTSISGAILGALGKGFSSAASSLKNVTKKFMALGSLKMFGGFGSKSSKVGVDLENRASTTDSLSVDTCRGAESVQIAQDINYDDFDDSDDHAASQRRRRLLDFGPSDYEEDRWEDRIG